MGTLHHLQVGCGDASVIQSSATFLVDCQRIGEHKSLLPSSKTIRGVFITHQHDDHFSGLKFLRDNRYMIEHLIVSPYVRRHNDNSVTKEEWDEFARYRDYFKARGTKIHKPYRQAGFDKPWWTTAGIKFWLLGPVKSVATSDTRELHDACLVFRADMGKRSCLFTGDASDANLQTVANLNNICGDILHASHHGSIRGADLSFIKRANALYTVVSTESGVYENVPHPTALRRYRDHTRKKVYRTDLDGPRRWEF